MSQGSSIVPWLLGSVLVCALTYGLAIKPLMREAEANEDASQNFAESTDQFAETNDCSGHRRIVDEARGVMKSKDEVSSRDRDRTDHALSQIRDNVQCFTRVEAEDYYTAYRVFWGQYYVDDFVDCRVDRYDVRRWREQSFGVYTAEGKTIIEVNDWSELTGINHELAVHEASCGTDLDAFADAFVVNLPQVPEDRRFALEETLYWRFYTAYYQGTWDVETEGLHELTEVFPFMNMMNPNGFLEAFGKSHWARNNGLPPDLTEDFQPSQEGVLMLLRWHLEGDYTHEYAQVATNWIASGYLDAERTWLMVCEQLIAKGDFPEAVAVANRHLDQKVVREVEQARIQSLRESGHYSVIVDPSTGRTSYLYPMYNERTWN